MELRLESENRWVLSNTDQESKIGCVSLYQIFASEWIFKTSLWRQLFYDYATASSAQQTTEYSPARGFS